MYSFSFLGQTQMLLYFIWSICRSNAFYIPDREPVEFVKGQIIDVQAVKMASLRTQLRYDYYSLKFCLPKNGTPVYSTEHAMQLEGQLLRSDLVVNTPYEINMADQLRCKLLCNEKGQPLTWDAVESNKAIKLIRNEYFVHL